ncbi:breast carcinoma-amplified sequence 4 isoform X2 [Ambystoma mexicanum]|uniref:breast carcinoma-amplified sequence 4 isoform X2 n=1 Tax=Ambystoma mexicanum TaxID=8296 RepID=UPI0037E75621
MEEEPPQQRGGHEHGVEEQQPARRKGQGAEEQQPGSGKGRGADVQQFREGWGRGTEEPQPRSGRGHGETVQHNLWGDTQEQQRLSGEEKAHMSGEEPGAVGELHMSGEAPRAVGELHMSGVAPGAVEELHMSGEAPGAVGDLHTSGEAPGAVGELHMSGKDPGAVRELHMSGEEREAEKQQHPSGEDDDAAEQQHLPEERHDARGQHGVCRADVKTPCADGEDARENTMYRGTPTADQVYQNSGMEQQVQQQQNYPGLEKEEEEPGIKELEGPGIEKRHDPGIKEEEAQWGVQQHPGTEEEQGRGRWSHEQEAEAVRDAQQATAKQFTYFMANDAIAEVKELEETIEEMLMRLDEFCGMTDMVRNESSELLDEDIPAIIAKVAEMNKVYTKVDKLEAFVKMVGRHVTFLEEQLIQAERDHQPFPHLVHKILQSANIPTFIYCTMLCDATSCSVNG